MIFVGIVVFEPQQLEHPVVCVHEILAKAYNEQVEVCNWAV